jgi:ABC-type arginine/histidine transport system permease subunit
MAVGPGVSGTSQVADAVGVVEFASVMRVVLPVAVIDDVSVAWNAVVVGVMDTVLVVVAIGVVGFAIMAVIQRQNAQEGVSLL